MSEERTALEGGRLLAEISRTFVAIRRDHYGRGPMKAKTYAVDDVLIVVMRCSGFTPLEQTMMGAGDERGVVALRQAFQDVMAGRFTEVVEELTGRRVVAFLAEASVEPDITVEMFVLDEPLGDRLRALAG